MIRFAQKEDGPQIVKLLMVIFKDMELPFIIQYGEKTTTEVLLDAMEDEQYRYAFRRGIVKEIDGEIAGAAFGYPAEEEPFIDEPLSKSLGRFDLNINEKLFIDKETFPNEWYLDSISVDSKFRGKGIGTELLEALPLLAQKDGKDVIGLSVDKGNPKAKKLYAQVGYEVVGQKIISGHLYDHMQLRISGS